MCLQLLQLLLKASQDKPFVCEKAEKSLEVMTTHMAFEPLLQKVETRGLCKAISHYDRVERVIV